MISNYKFRFTGYLSVFILLMAGSISLKANIPERVISLAPSLTKNLYLLEAESLLVGCTNYCTIQSETKATVVANAVQVNFEKSVLLKPDLVITTDLTKVTTIETFRKLGIRVLVFKNPKNFNEICEQFIELGSKIGKREFAEEIISSAIKELDKKLELIPKGNDKQKIFMQIGANPLFAVVPGSFMNDYIHLSQTENIFSDVEFGNVSYESVLIRNPEIIIVVLMGNINEEEKKYWEKFRDLSAVRNQQVFTLDADDACSPTPDSFIVTVERLINMIYK